PGRGAAPPRHGRGREHRRGVRRRVGAAASRAGSGARSGRAAAGVGHDDGQPARLRLMARVVVNRRGIEELEASPEVAETLLEAAERVKGRVRAPSHLRLFTRAGVGPRGAYSQVRMFGRAAVAIEFGSKRAAPLAPLRRALRGGG